MGNRWLQYGIVGMISVLVLMCLSVSWLNADSLPSDILEGEWKRMYVCCVGSFAGLAVLILGFPQRLKDYLPVVVSWTFILLGAVESIWGIRQVYGFTYSNHSLYALTGSFYNPGPYSGYLAMIFPVCLYECLKWKEKKKTIPYYIALFVMLLILCVLPAGMSRSAWIAATVSSAYVASMYYRKPIRSCIKHYWNRTRGNRNKMAAYGLTVILMLCIILSGVYYMKKDSADGRLFMWKTAARAVCERPWTGYGWDNVASAYGQAQEDYFATGDYTATEERVAGTPEYVFNEYLQVAIAWGLPVLCVGLLMIGVSWYAGHRRREYGLCGALLSLAVFAFSSYPLQFPAFVSALIMLLLACGMGTLPLKKFGMRILFASLLIGAGYVCFYKYQQKEKTLNACRLWIKSRMFYQSGAYPQAVESYAEIYEAMTWNGRFMFEYGHALHKLHRPEESNKILQEALRVSGDPMILNIIGKNEQEMKNYENAERWLTRATHRLPGRIYPYYLLACLYADSAFYQREKLERMVSIVLEKEPKVQSTAVRQMRQKAKELLKKGERD